MTARRGGGGGVSESGREGPSTNPHACYTSRLCGLEDFYARRLTNVHLKFSVTARYTVQNKNVNI